MEAPEFLIVGMNHRYWEQFVTWFDERNAPWPNYPDDGVFVADARHRGILLAGCCIYPCAGPYAVVEFAATNPEAPVRQRYEAMLFGASVLPLYGAMRGKVMLCFPRSKGMGKLLERAGFAYEKTPVMVPRMP